MARRTDYPEPRSVQRTGNYPYRFVEYEDFAVPTGWTLPRPFVAQWLEIATDGVVTVKANRTGYAWDGCTPKFSVFNLFIAGVPDGHVDYRTSLPFTYRASMVHDALYQYLDTIPVSKKRVDQLFLTLMGDFKPRHIYYFFVRHFGGRGVVQRGLDTTPPGPA